VVVAGVGVVGAVATSGARLDGPILDRRPRGERAPEWVVGEVDVDLPPRVEPEEEREEAVEPIRAELQPLQPLRELAELVGDLVKAE